MAWDTTVATAAPATPIGMTTIQNTSRKIFKIAAVTRNTTGVLLSPSDRRMAAVIL